MKAIPISEEVQTEAEEIMACRKKRYPSKPATRVQAGRIERAIKRTEALLEKIAVKLGIEPEVLSE